MNGPSKQKQLTGRHVLLILFAFFGVTFAVNAYFTVVAVTSFRGEDVPRSYRQGLEYNDTIAARSVQNELGWQVQVNHTDKEVILFIQNNLNRPLSNLKIQAKLRHPVDTDKDQAIAFIEDPDGLYRAPVRSLSGRWSLVGVAKTGETKFNFESKLWE